MIYDIRSSNGALKTLITLTHVPMEIWMQYLSKINKYKYVENMIEEVVDLYGEMPRSYEDWDFTYFHITTSRNNCKNFRKYGILDLRQAYLCEGSELREFLDQADIHIDLEKNLLTHNNKAYDVSYSSIACPRRGTLEYDCWSIGRKFYFDFTTCGFLSVSRKYPYAGDVHRRPEILMDIDNLLKLNLSKEWERSSRAYEVVARVKGCDVVYPYDEIDSNRERVLCYLTKAFDTAFNSPREDIVLLKNNVYIKPSDILEINQLCYWIK